MAQIMTREYSSKGLDTVYVEDDGEWYEMKTVVHGHWIPHDKIVDVFSYASGYGQCSACKKVRWLALTNGRQMNYCPSCGARMDEKDGDSNDTD